jgi:hypothetical protein
MGGARASADDRRVRARILLAALVGVVTVATLAGASTQAVAGRACVTGTHSGYAYAGNQASYRGHGVRATITMTRTPSVEAGHVAGWVGVGGPGQGADGEDAWIQGGIASLPGMDPMIYAEITRAGRTPQLIPISDNVAPGRGHTLAVLEVGSRPGWWRVWVDGRAVTKPVHMRGSSSRWAPIATAESWNAGTAVCNSFGFRFERVSVSYGGGGSWRPFVPAHRFRDSTNVVRDLASAPAQSGVYRHPLAGEKAVPYAFIASSGS